MRQIGYPSIHIRVRAGRYVKLRIVTISRVRFHGQRSRGRLAGTSNGPSGSVQDHRLRTLVDAGEVGDDDHLRLWLRPSHDNFRAYTTHAERPYDRVDFEVLTCLRAASTCQGLTFDNQGWSTYEVSYQVDDGRGSR
jgi:hypothetical protein